MLPPKTKALVFTVRREPASPKAKQMKFPRWLNTIDLLRKLPKTSGERVHPEQRCTPALRVGAFFRRWSRLRAVEGASPYGLCAIPFVGRRSRTAEDVGPYGLVRFSIVGRGLRAVEGAFPVAVPEKICGLALSLIFSTAAMFAKANLQCSA